MSQPKSRMLALNAALTKHKIGSLLDEQSLSGLSRTCTQYRDLFKNKCADRKKAAELLFCVVNINESRKRRILELLSEPQAENQSIILIRVTAKEVYQSNKQNKLICKREWTYSVLEAAAKCGDNFLVQLFVTKVPEGERPEALKQLQGIRAQRTSAESGSYLSGIPALRKANKEYLETYQTLAAAENMDEVDRLWGEVGEAHKNLSIFGLQVFCNPVPHSLTPDFTKEPKRSCQLWDNSELDLESIGTSRSYALYKGQELGVGRGMGDDVTFAAATIDAANLDILYEVLPAQLDKIIKSLSPTEERVPVDAEHGTSDFSPR